MDDAETVTLATSEDCEHRASLLIGPAFTTLDAYSRSIAVRFGPTPHVDPLDGGADARLLLLLETPGPRGPTPRFVSCDNPTGTARNLRRYLGVTGIERRQIVLWNAVPWIIHADGAQNRAPNRAEMEQGLALLPAFLALLPQLRVVVTAGRIAALATGIIRETRPDVPILAMPHPSPTHVNTSPTVAARIVATLAEAQGYLGTPLKLVPIGTDQPPAQ